MSDIYRGTRLETTAAMAAAIARAGFPQRVEPTRWETESGHVDGYGRPTIWVQGWHIVTTAEVESVLASVMADTAALPKGAARRERREKLVTERLLALGGAAARRV